MWDINYLCGNCEECIGEANYDKDQFKGVINKKVDIINYDKDQYKGVINKKVDIKVMDNV